MATLGRAPQLPEPRCPIGGPFSSIHPSPFQASVSDVSLTTPEPNLREEKKRRGLGGGVRPLLFGSNDIMGNRSQGHQASMEQEASSTPWTKERQVPSPILE